MPSRCPNSRLIVANIVSRSERLLTSARTARLPGPSVSLVAFSVSSFKPQMATRAPSLSNSCAAASPIPLLPPVMSIFLFVSLAIVVRAAGSDDERRQGGRYVPNHAPTMASSVLNQDIAGRQHHLRAIVKLECHGAGEKDPEIRSVGPVKALVSSTGSVAILEVHLGSGFWCNELSWQVRPADVADATYGSESAG